MVVDVVAPPIPIETCRAGGCGFVAVNGGLCERHIRALRLTTRVQDALLDFLNTRDVIRPGRVFDRDIVLAGEYLTDGLSLLIGALFGDVIFEPSPIFAAVTKGGSNHGATRWRVNLMWSLVCDGDGDGEDDEHDEDDELGNDEDDELGNNDEDR